MVGALVAGTFPSQGGELSDNYRCTAHEFECSSTHHVR